MRMRRARPQPYCRHASAPGARADASGKLSNLIADMPRPRSACGCVGQALQPYCRHAPDPGAHADAPPKAPFPTMFRQPPPAARPDGNFRQASPPGQESRVALPVPSKRPALMKAGPFARRRASIRRQSPHACGRSREVRVAGVGFPTLSPNTPHTPRLSHPAKIMTTGLAGGLTKPYKGMRPAALTRSESLPTASPFTGSR